MHKFKNINNEILKLKKENTFGIDEEQNERKNIRRLILFFFVFLLVLYFATFGITVSFYKGGSDEPQEIETGILPPTIHFNPETVASEVEVTIDYPNTLTKKYYRIVYEDGTDSGWLEYTGPFIINKNNTQIYAKGSNQENKMSEVVNRVVIIMADNSNNGNYIPTPTPSASPKPADATDQIIFTYSDVDKSGNGINLVNAMPMADSKGKMLTGTGNYFDFSVTATSKKANLLYKILINKDVASTLANKNVRIYLTSVSGSYESELILTTFDSLEKTTINGTEYYVLYQKQLNKGINNYSDFYRLRMWVKEDATDYNDKMFMLKVDVVAEQVGD